MYAQNVRVKMYALIISIKLKTMELGKFITVEDVTFILVKPLVHQ